jgi:hypothetical protein
MSNLNKPMIYNHFENLFNSLIQANKLKCEALPSAHSHHGLFRHDLYYSVKELNIIFDNDKSTISQWTKKGDLKPFLLGKNKLRYLIADVKVFFIQLNVTQTIQNTI